MSRAKVHWASRGSVCLAMLVLSACGGAGRLTHPAGVSSSIERIAPSREVTRALDAFAPIVMQEQRYGERDLPTALPTTPGNQDLGPGPVPCYASAESDLRHLYLLYVFYYAHDLAFATGAVDHAGDLEGALVIVDRDRCAVEAVITQAHGRFYLFVPPGGALPLGASGEVPLSATGRPVLFSEAGGHGFYAFGSGEWTPRGGARYRSGPAGVDPRSLVQLGGLEDAWTEAWRSGSDTGIAFPAPRPLELRAMSELDRACDRFGRLIGEGPDARHPRRWTGKHLGSAWQAGAILDHPGALYRVLARRVAP